MRAIGPGNVQLLQATAGTAECGKAVTAAIEIDQPVGLPVGIHVYRTEHER